MLLQSSQWPTLLLLKMSCIKICCRICRRPTPKSPTSMDPIYTTAVQKRDFPTPFTAEKSVSGPDSEKEQVILDENKLAEGRSYTDVQAYVPSPSHQRLAYAVDYSGYETYAIHIVDNIATGRELHDVIEGASGSLLWGNDDSVLFYMKMDEEHRPHQLYMHVLGTPQSEDVMVLAEDDGRFWMDAGKTADDMFLVVGVESKETSEHFVVDLRGLVGGDQHAQAVAESADTKMRCIHPRNEGVRYDVEHHNGYFYCVTNVNNAQNNKLTRCRVSDYYYASSGSTPADKSKRRISRVPQWRDVRPYDSAEQIDRIIPFARHIAVFGRKNGMRQLWIIPVSPSVGGSAGETDQSSPDPDVQLGEWRQVSFPEAAYALRSGDNYMFESGTLRYVYSSLITPRQVVDYDMTTGQRRIRKQQVVPGYDASRYECIRLEAPSADGKRQIPMSIVYNKKLLTLTGTGGWGGGAGAAVGAAVGKKISNRPVLLYGYGSYGSCIDPGFDYRRSTLLDRGVVYVIAHIRGGGEMGRFWYEDEGKYLSKMNTFQVS